MAILAVDEVMLREPRLLVPRRTPIGPIKIDRQNRLVPDYRAYVQSGSAWIDLLTNEVSTGLSVPTAGETGLRFAAASTAGSLTNRYFYSRTEFTALAMVTAVAEATAVRACCYQSSGTTAGYNGGGSNSTIHEIHFAHTANAQWQFCYQPGSVNGYTDPSAYGGTVIPGKPTVLVGTAVESGVDANLYVDGVLVGSNSITSIASYVTPTLSRWNDVGYVTAGRWWNGGIHCLYVWSRILSDTEIAAISADPFQILIPA